MIGALLLVALSVLVWALLRGPRLALPCLCPYGRFGRTPTVNKPGQVIDAEVREVLDVHEAHDVDEMPSPSRIGASAYVGARAAVTQRRGSRSKRSQHRADVAAEDFDHCNG